MEMPPLPAQLTAPIEVRESVRKRRSNSETKLTTADAGSTFVAKRRSRRMKNKVKRTLQQTGRTGHRSAGHLTSAANSTVPPASNKVCRTLYTHASINFSKSMLLSMSMPWAIILLLTVKTVDKI